LQICFLVDLYGYRLDIASNLGPNPFAQNQFNQLAEQIALAVWGLSISLYHSLVVRGDAGFGDRSITRKSCLRSFKSRRAHLRNPASNGYRYPNPETVEASKQRAEEDGNLHLFQNAGKNPDAIYIAPSKPVQLGSGWSVTLELNTAAADHLLSQ